MSSPLESLTPIARKATPNRPMSIRVLTTIAVGAVLYFGRAAFIPIALAVLFSLILTTPVEALHRRGLPRGASALMILVILIGVVGGAVNLLSTPAQTWWASAPHTLRTIERRIRPASNLLNRIELLSTRASQMAAPPAAKSPARPGTSSVPANEPTRSAPSPAAAPPSTGVALAFLDQTRAALISTVTVVVVTLLLLIGGPLMSAKMVAALAGDLQSTRFLEAVTALRSEVSRYYVSIALINVGLGSITAAFTFLLGMPDPLLWGAVAAILNFVPYVGSATTLLLLTIVAFVTFDTFGRVAAVAGCYIALAAVEGQIVQPLVVGRRLELNPILVFLTLWFGGWFWGIAGIILAVPSLVALKVVAEHSEHAKALGEFLSPNHTAKFHPDKLTAKLGFGKTPKGEAG